MLGHIFYKLDITLGSSRCKLYVQIYSIVTTHVAELQLVLVSVERLTFSPEFRFLTVRR